MFSILEIYTTFVSKYKIILVKSRELRKIVVLLNLFVSPIVL